MVLSAPLETAAFMPHNNFRPSTFSSFRTATGLYMSDYLNSLSKPSPYQKTALKNPAAATNMVPYNNTNKVPPKKHTQPPGRETNSMNEERVDPYTKKDPTCGPSVVSRPISRELGGVSPSEQSRLNPTGAYRTYETKPGSLPVANNNEALGKDMVWDNDGVLKRGKGGNPGGDLMTWR